MILIVGRIQSHFKIIGCDSMWLTSSQSYSLFQCMHFIAFGHAMINKDQISTEKNFATKLVKCLF